MKKKVTLLLLTLFFSRSYLLINSAEKTWRETIFDNSPIWLQQLFNPQEKKFKSAVKENTSTWGTLNLYQFFSQKEENNSITNPRLAAEKFKKAVVASTQKNSIMKHFFENNQEKFLFGASSSAYQYEGGLDDYTANAFFYKQKGLQPAEQAIRFWHNYKDDIKHMKEELGINCFRLSIAWERVAQIPEVWNKPGEMIWNQAAINTYIDIIKTLKQYHIEPIVVLNHYTIPQWFAEMGGFEKKENIIYFVEFAKKMYVALHEHVTYWSTFNAIEGYAFKGYWTQDSPPGIHNMQLTQTVMIHMLESHVQIYQTIKGPQGLYHHYKTQPNIPEPLIGLQKNIVILDPHEKAHICVQAATQPFCILGTMVQNKGFFDFFKTGIFSLHIPFWVNVFHENKQAPQSLDWIGLNTYGNMRMELKTAIAEDRPDFMTENANYRDYPEGMYRAIKILYDSLAKPLNIPIIITENGIATKNDAAGNEKRERFFRRTLYTIRKLIEEGYPIIGYTPWASHDNYEWPSIKHPHSYNRFYGFFEVKRDDNLSRKLKSGAHYYRNFIKEYLKKIPTSKL